MSLINIPLIKGENWISFPESTSDNLLTIFSKSGLGNVTIYKYDPLKSTGSTESGFVLVDLTSYVEMGKGYHVITTNVGTISYMGTPYKQKMTFDRLRSSLMRGYNLVGTDNNIIDISRYDWCRIVDAQTNFSATEIAPGKAYWIYYEDCQQPKLGLDTLTKISILGLAITTYVVFGEDIKALFRRRKEVGMGTSKNKSAADRNKKLLLI